MRTSARCAASEAASASAQAAGSPSPLPCVPSVLLAGTPALGSAPAAGTCTPACSRRRTGSGSASSWHGQLTKSSRPASPYTAGGQSQCVCYF